MLRRFISRNEGWQNDLALGEGMVFQQDFLSDIASQTFDERQSRQREFFLKRFQKNSYELTHKEIGSQLVTVNSARRLSSWGLVVNEIVQALGETFQSEIGLSEFRLGSQEGNVPGRPRKGEGPWELAYDWLWYNKYPSWLKNQDLWQRLINASSHAGGMMYMREVSSAFPAGERGLQSLELEPQITKGKHQRLYFNFKSEGHLLLLARDETGLCYCLCPSAGYAPSGIQLSATREAMLPSPESLAATNGQYLKFSDLGQESFLAVVTKEPLTPSWAKPDKQYHKLTTDSFVELDEYLQRQEAQLFCKVFEVVALV
jgi:hypothetical protein